MPLAARQNSRLNWSLALIIVFPSTFPLTGCAGGESAGSATEETPPVAMHLEADCDGFFASPWPHDARLSAHGTQVLDGFPIPDGDVIIGKHVEQFEEQVGFGTTSALYVGFNGRLDPDALPEDGADSLEPNASVFLANIDPKSPDFGERTPIRCTIRSPTGNCPGEVLACIPVAGFPLRPATRYGLYVTSTMRGLDGRALIPPEQWSKVMSAEVDDPMAHSYGPFFEYVSTGPETEVSVIAGMPFRTQDPVSPLQAIANWLDSRPPPTAESLTETEYPSGVSPEEANYAVYQGTYVTTTFQQGTPPFAGKGGEIAFSDDGAPMAAGSETLQFILTLPKGRMPEAGFPIAMVIHDASLTAGARSIAGVLPELALDLAEVGVALFSINLPLYETRNRGEVPDGVLFFNFTNLAASRNNLRQGAADLLQARDLLENLRFPATHAEEVPTVQFDSDRFFLVAHSVGAMVATLALGTERSWAAAYLSSAQGTGLLSIFDKVDPEPVLPIVRSLFGLQSDQELDVFHPGFALVQAFREVAAPEVFARNVYDWTEDCATHVWVTQALEDRTAPLSDNDNLVAAFGLDPAGEIPRPIHGLALRDTTAQTLPVRLNRRASDGQHYTAIVSQVPDVGYEGFFASARIREQLKGWLATAVETGAPELQGTD